MIAAEPDRLGRACQNEVVQRSHVKTLVERLTAEGHVSPHLERLRERLVHMSSPTTLEKEIASEMAAALGRTEEKLLVALVELEVAGKKLAAASAGARPALVDEFNALRKIALDRRWELEIHREAIGILQNKVLVTMYPIPERARRDR